MATVRKRQWLRRDGSVSTAWLVAYRDLGGNRRFQAFKTKREAEIARHQIAIELTNRTHIPKSRVSLTPDDLPKYAISDIIGIYFLYDGNECVYVGQSLCIHKRISEHAQRGIIEFDGFKFVPCKAEDLDEVERRYIVKLNPKYNGRLPVDRRRRRPFMGEPKEPKIAF